MTKTFDKPTLGQDALAIGLLAVVCVAVFGRAVGFHLVNWDDDLYVLSPLVRHWFDRSWSQRLATGAVGYPVPLPIAIYALATRAFGVKGVSGPLHAVNVAVHLLNALLLFGLCRRFKLPRVAATLAAAVWMVHPVVVEPVCWATGLKELLTATGALVSAHGALRLLDADRAPPPALGILVLGSVIAFASKPTAAVLGPMLVFMALVFAQAPARRRLILGGLGAALTALGAWLALGALHTNKAYGGHEVHGHVVSRIVAAVNAQLGHVLVPLNLGPRYEYAAPDAVAWLSVIAVSVGALVASWWMWRRGNRAGIFGLGWAAIWFFPVSNIIPLGRFTADSYAYLPLAGLALTLATLIAPSSDERADAERPRRRAYLVTAAVTAIFCALAAVQCGIWSSGTTLWTHELARLPDNGLVYMKLGQALYRQGRYHQAIEAFEHVGAELGTTVPFPPRWAFAYCQIHEVDRCDDVFALGLRRGLHSHTVAAENDWQYLVHSYAQFLDYSGRPPSPKIPPKALADVRRELAKLHN